MSGERDLEAFASIHFTSKALGKALVAAENGAMLTFVFNGSTIAVVVAHDVRKGDFVIHVPFFPPMQSAKDFEDNSVVKQLIDACISSTGKHDIPYKLESVKAWGMHATRADRFSCLGNRLFFVGDAAHQFPPSGGFGVNTGFVDAHNLIWKVAKAKTDRTMTSETSSTLLTTYESERKPVCETAINVAVDNYRRGLLPAKVLGLDRGMLSSLVSMMDHNQSQSLFNKIVLFGQQQMSLIERGHLESRVEDLKRIVEEEGEALPLLFPEVDLGYSYQSIDTTVKQVDDVLLWNKPVERHLAEPMHVRMSLIEGGILPHIFVEDPSTGRSLSTLGKPIVSISH